MKRFIVELLTCCSLRAVPKPIITGTVWWSESKVGIGRMHGEVPIEHLGDEFRLTGQIVIDDNEPSPPAPRRGVRPQAKVPVRCLAAEKTPGGRMECAVDHVTLLTSRPDATPDKNALSQARR